MDHQNPSSSKIDRKTVEKNRRDQMKALYSELNSLIPHHAPPKEMVTLPDQLAGATNYIKLLQARLEEMKTKKEWLKGMHTTAPASCSSTNGGVNLPSIDIRVTGPALEVVLITGLNCQFMFNEIIRMLHEDAAEVVSASFSQLENTVFHTIHSKIGDSAHDHGAERISERLRKYVYGFS